MTPNLCAKDKFRIKGFGAACVPLRGRLFLTGDDFGMKYFRSARIPLPVWLCRGINLLRLGVRVHMCVRVRHRPISGTQIQK